MRKILFIFGLAGFSFLTLYSVYAQDKDVNVLFKQLRNELLNSRVQARDVNSIAAPLKSLLKNGAAKGDLRNIVLNLTRKGVTDKELYISLDSVNMLVEAGAKVNESANVVSQAIDQGLALGFKGGDVGLAAKVQEAVKKKAKLLEEEKKKKQAEVKDQAI
ncbi:MAG: hypothetical protein PHC71_02035 [Candidatus Omnitrophica bacterium]|nr:hypothetical protein [Candidatus Omnitrophota bacterium]